MQNSWSYISDSRAFKDKINRIENIPKDAIIVTADVVELYRCIPNVAGLKALKNDLDGGENKYIPTEKLLKMAEFVLRNNVFEFNGTIKEQTSGTAMGTKCTLAFLHAYLHAVMHAFLCVNLKPDSSRAIKINLQYDLFTLMISFFYLNTWGRQI